MAVSFGTINSNSFVNSSVSLEDKKYNITTNASATTQIRLIALKDYDPADSYYVNGSLRQLKQVDGNPIAHGWVTGAPLVFNLGEDGISMYMDINDVGAVGPKSELIYSYATPDNTTSHGILDIDNDLNFRVNKLSNDTDLTSTRYGVIKYFNKDIPEVSDYGIDRPDAEFYHVFDTENYRVMVAGKYYPPEPVNSIIVTNTTTDEQVYNGLAPTEIDAQSVVEYSNNIYILGGYAKYADGEGAGCIITSDGRMIDMPAVEVVNENAVLVGDLIFDDQYEYLLGIGHSVIDVSTPESPVGKTTTPMVMVTQALSNYNVVGQDAQGRPYQVYTYDERRADQMVIHGRSPSFSPDEYFSPSPITTDGLSEFVFLHDTSPSSDAWAFDSVVIIDGSTCDVLYEVPIDMNYNGVPQYIDKGTTRAKYWYDKTNNILYISILGVLSDDHYENYGLFQYKITF